MIILIGGASHTGKTALAQRLMEKHKIPYMSIDHLKMGLIRSGKTHLTPEDDDELTGYLWPIVREMIKTAIENSQSLIIEGCYIPFDWESDFSDEYLKKIRYVCLVMTRRYIEEKFDIIKRYANVVENRKDDSGCEAGWLVQENERNLEQCKKFGCEYILIDNDYSVELGLSDETGR